MPLAVSSGKYQGHLSVEYFIWSDHFIVALILFRSYSGGCVYF